MEETIQIIVRSEPPTRSPVRSAAPDATVASHLYACMDALDHHLNPIDRVRLGATCTALYNHDVMQTERHNMKPLASLHRDITNFVAKHKNDYDRLTDQVPHWLLFWKPRKSANRATVETLYDRSTAIPSPIPRLVAYSVLARAANTLPFLQRDEFITRIVAAMHALDFPSPHDQLAAKKLTLATRMRLEPDNYFDILADTRSVLTVAQALPAREQAAALTQCYDDIFALAAKHKIADPNVTNAIDLTIRRFVKRRNEQLPVHTHAELPPQPEVVDWEIDLRPDCLRWW